MSVIILFSLVNIFLSKEHLNNVDESILMNLIIDMTISYLNYIIIIIILIINRINVCVCIDKDYMLLLTERIFFIQ